jgi:glutamate-5-semialdehyde dehydrogenase
MAAVVPDATKLESCALGLAQRARTASRTLALAATDQKNNWLTHAAALLRTRRDELMAANRRDLDAAPGFGLTAAQIDRLTLDAQRIEAMAAGLDAIVALRDPVGEVIESTVRPNGLKIDKVRVPLGVILFIYESRPNVTADAAALCVKSGNAVILRGGKEAIHTNLAIHSLFEQSLADCGLPADSVQMVNIPDRELVDHLLHLNRYIDLAIPRGGESLIRRVAAEATMPVMKHFQGICHVYVHAAADQAMARSIVLNAKCQRPGVCNAAESLLVDRAIAGEFLPPMLAALQQSGIEIRGCSATQRFAPGVIAATDQDYSTEYLDLKLSVRVVDGLDEAVEHIARFGSAHTDAIITRDPDTAAEFTRRVDSSAVMVNASTRFNDGFEFGLGAEIGISTDKYHARGPCGLRELTSYKHVVTGTGQIRT